MNESDLCEDVESDPPEDSLRGMRIALVGKFGGMPQREVRRLLRDRGAVVVDGVTPDADLVVIGADELPLDEEDLLDDRVRDAAAAGHLEVISETRLWERLGLVEDEEAERLCTPAMLAELLDVPIAIVRRWHRRGLIVPVREVRRLPYFDFREISTARQLAQLLSAGMSPDLIERKLARLARFVPDVERPLAQLSVIVQGKQLLLRQEGGLVEPGGQLRIDFDAIAAGDSQLSVAEPAPASPPLLSALPSDASARSLLDTAAELEEEGRLEEAAEWCRAAMAATGPTPDTCFQLAELLYRMGDASACARALLHGDRARRRLCRSTPRIWVVCWRRQARMSWPWLHLKGRCDSTTNIRMFTTTWRGHSTNCSSRTRRSCIGASLLRLAPDSPWSDQARRRLGLSDNSGK